MLFKCYLGVPLQPTIKNLVRFFGYQLRCNFSIKEAGIGPVNIDRKVQGCRFPLIPSNPCLNAVSRSEDVKCEGEFLLL